MLQSRRGLPRRSPALHRGRGSRPRADDTGRHRGLVLRPRSPAGGQQMSHAYIRTRDDDDPYYVSPEEEKQMEADAEVERLHTEVARQESIIADLQEALSEAINYL